MSSQRLFNFPKALLLLLLSLVTLLAFAFASESQAANEPPSAAAERLHLREKRGMPNLQLPPKYPVQQALHNNNRQRRAAPESPEQIQRKKRDFIEEL
ncbi:hypothetical protein DFS34DRAFT_695330 [Phlyctochytrium arcticum]|nr:hypothetical protein DFS34DRAFT_695330 [Phlyctochytrium arcticum]